MSWDVLLHWMTHLGEGSWSSFRGAVAKLADADADIDVVCPRLRIALSDLGHADFFVEDTQRWRVLPPVMAGLAPGRQAVVLTGGCTPQLRAAVLEAAGALGCASHETNGEIRPSLLRLEGPPETLRAAAASAGVPHVEDFALSLCASLKPIALQIQGARMEEAPPNWVPYSFDLDSLTWVEGLHRRSACELRPRYGRSRFYFHTKGGHLLRLDRCEGGKRFVVYAAAMIREVTLAVYDAGAEVLSLPISAPLPEIYARAACLCAGAPAEVREGRLLYRHVPQAIAAVLLVAAGQPYPELSHG